ncbi:MAG: flavodoxin [Spirochaetota bacterium]
MASIGIFYGSSTGNTENAAEKIAQAFGSGEAEATEISSATEDEILGFDKIVFGVSTWGAGDLQDDFEDFMSTLEGMDFSGKKVAVFGLGDQENYPDTFVDAMGIVAKAVQSAGGTIVGKTSTDGYTFDASEAQDGSSFLGLALDEDNQSDQSQDRIAAWVAQLKKEFG